MSHPPWYRPRPFGINTLSRDMNLYEYATLFRCPRCRGELAPHPSDLPDASGAVEGFTCGACRVRYPAHDGIVNFTPDDAIALTEGDAQP